MPDLLRRRSDPRARRGRLARAAGLAGWLPQPVYVGVELAVAAVASAAYSLRDDTISALGQLTCVPGHDGGTIDVCSPAHPVMNAAFIAFGALRGAGALAVHGQLAPSRWRTAATALWLVSGAGCAAVGLVPVDQDPDLHALVAAPVFVCQPLAVLATAMALRGTAAGNRWRTADAGLAVGAVTAVAAVAFVARLGSDTWVGGLERLALWPAYPWLAAAAVALAAPGVPDSSSETVTSS